MKKKLFLTIVMTFVFALALIFAVSAEETSIHNSTTVDYNATVTLGKEFTLADGSTTNTVQLFDGEDALIWYLDGGVLKSVHADDARVEYVTTTADFNLGIRLSGVKIDSTSVTTNIVVFNVMDDDAAKNIPQVRGFGTSTNLEYAYLRLDTQYIGDYCFNQCTNLKYVNLEELTNLTLIGVDKGGAFNNCSRLFVGQALDLRDTVLKKIRGADNFYKVGFVDIKLPNTVIELGSGTFKSSKLQNAVFPESLTAIPADTYSGCVSLSTVYLSSELTTIGNNAFNGCTALETICFVGTEDDFVNLNVGATGNSQFTKAKVVYNYNYCEAYKDGNHTVTTNTSACVGTCDVCEKSVVNHVNGNTAITVTYTSYLSVGTKTTACKNEGCTYSETAESPKLFTCLGYSAPSYGSGGIAIGFAVNNKAIAEYEEVTGKTLKYGVFAVLKDRLGTNDVFGENGAAASGVINAEISRRDFAAFELKIIGFADEQKDTKLAMGAYVAVTYGEATEYSYMQAGTPGEGEKYCFVSYNDIAGEASTDK